MNLAPYQYDSYQPRKHYEYDVMRGQTSDNIYILTPDF